MLLEASAAKDRATQDVVAVGCLAERYGEQLAAELPEADAVLGFDSYADMSDHLTAILAAAPRLPRDSATAPAALTSPAPAGASGVALPGHGERASAPSRPPEVLGSRVAVDVPAPASGPRVIGTRLDGRLGAAEASPAAATGAAPSAPSRCSAAPSCPPAHRHRGGGAGSPSVASRGGLPRQRELHLLRQGPRRPRAPRELLPELTAIGGIERVRVSTSSPPRSGRGCSTPWRRRPAWCLLRPLLPACLAPLLRRMRPLRGARGVPGAPGRGPRARPRGGRPQQRHRRVPGETEADLAELEAFLVAARSTSWASSATPTRTAPRPRATGRRCRTTSSPSALRGSAP